MMTTHIKTEDPGKYHAPMHILRPSGSDPGAPTFFVTGI